MTALRPRVLLVLALLFGLVASVCLAHASPVDPTWLAGVYDDADHDDVILAVISAAGILEAEPVGLASPRLVPVRLCLGADLASPPVAPLPAWQIRAPPGP